MSDSKHPVEKRKSRIPALALDGGAVLLLGILVCLFFWRILTPNLDDRASFPPGDFAYQFWAFASLEVRELAAGNLPLWNPFSYAGSPFWADVQSAVFYPVSFLTLILAGPHDFSLFSLELEAIFHFWLAGVFTYAYGRRVFRRRAVALFTAIVFTFGGYLTGYPSQQLAVLETNVWLPLLLLCIDRALVDRSGSAIRLWTRFRTLDILAAGLVWGIVLLAGHPQSAMFVFYAFTAYIVFLALAYRKGPPSESSQVASAFWKLVIGDWLAVLLVGLGLSAVAWLPALEYMRLSVRAAGFYDKMAGGFPLYDPIQMLLPGSVSHYSPLYVGILPLLLGIWAALTLRRREVYFWAGMAVVTFLLSFGGETFLYTPFYLVVPGFSIFRDQERAAFLFSFAMAMLAGYGFQYLLAKSGLGPGREKADSGLQRVTGWLLVGSLGLVVLFFYGLNSVGWQDDSPFNLLLSRSVWLAVLLALAWGLMHAARIRGSTDPNRRRLPVMALVAAGCVLLVVLDLFTANWKTNVHPLPPENQTTEPAVVQAIYDDAGADDLFRVYNEYRVYENYGVPFGLEDAWGASPLRPERYDRMYQSLRMERIWELLNVKYVISWREELYAPSQIIYQESADDGTTYVHRLQEISPRAWLVYQVEEVDDEEALARLDAFDFEPDRVALVPPNTSLATGQPPADDSGRVEIVERDNQSLALKVRAAADGLLVLSEIDYPGWQATVDSRPVSILRTNYTLRGIPVEAGEHQINLVFRPSSLVLGLVISGVTLLAVLVAGVWGWLRWRRQR